MKEHHSNNDSLTITSVAFYSTRKKKRVREQKKKLRERLAGKLEGAGSETNDPDQEMFALSLINNQKVSIFFMFSLHFFALS